MAQQGVDHLWGLIQADNANAFEQLYELYWDALYNTVYWRVCDEDIAKDIVQDLFITLWEKRKSILIHETLEGYLKVMARNKVLNHFKAAATRQKHSQSAGHLITEVNSTEDLLIAKEVNRYYQAAIRRLPEKMREIYLLNKEKGLSIDEIADQLSLSAQTVKNQLTSAAKKIRAELEPLLNNPKLVSGCLVLLLAQLYFM
jgi:RNA polymerase sigma-70 factor (family 1)